MYIISTSENVNRRHRAVRGQRHAGSNHPSLQSHLENHLGHAAQQKQRHDIGARQKPSRNQKACERQNHQSPQAVDLRFVERLNLPCRLRKESLLR